MLRSLLNTPSAHQMIPFVMLAYGQESCYLWRDSAGNTHEVRQGEGGEQGDPLMPMLYALGQYPALQHMASQLQANERIYAFLDDIYITCTPDRVRILYDLLSQ